MSSLASQVVTVADNQISHLAKRSKELDQETRVTVYTFENRTVKCLIYDKDVLRLPSIKGMYRPNGGTNLIDATLKSIEDLEKTPELYGEHAFLIYVLTDGEENQSLQGPATLKKRLQLLPDHWTLAAFVPDQNGIYEAKKFGFSPDNIAVWSTTSKGISEVGETIRKTTDLYMQARTTGVRGYKNLFNLDLSNLSTKAVKKLQKLTPGQFRMLAVDSDEPIAEFVERKLRRAYKLGEGYYQLTKPVEVQPQKSIALYERKAHSVYVGRDARDLLGLPTTHTVKVQPTSHPQYEIFIQSTSVNRKLLRNTNLLLIS